MIGKLPSSSSIAPIGQNWVIVYSLYFQSPSYSDVHVALLHHFIFLNESMQIMEMLYLVNTFIMKYMSDVFNESLTLTFSRIFFAS